MSDGRQTVAILGGTGPQGRGLAYRLARAGYRVVIGSREQERAAEAAAEINERTASDVAVGQDNLTAARAGDVVMVAVPWKGHDELVRQVADALAGKVVVSCVNPLGFDQDGPFGLALGETSAAETLQGLVPDARVTAAFHHVAAGSLLGPSEQLEGEDVLVASDDPEAAAVACELAAGVVGRPGVHAGRLRLARQLEPFTAVLLSLNRLNKAKTGLALTGLTRG